MCTIYKAVLLMIFLLPTQSYAVGWPCIIFTNLFMKTQVRELNDWPEVTHLIHPRRSGTGLSSLPPQSDPLSLLLWSPELLEPSRSWNGLLLDSVESPCELHEGRVHVFCFLLQSFELLSVWHVADTKQIGIISLLKLEERGFVLAWPILPFYIKN